MGLSIVQPGSYRRAPARRPACGLQAANSPPPGAAKNCPLRRKTRYFAQLQAITQNKHFAQFFATSASSGPRRNPARSLRAARHAAVCAAQPLAPRPRAAALSVAAGLHLVLPLLRARSPAVAVPSRARPGAVRPAARPRARSLAPACSRPPQLGGEQIWPSPPKLGGRDLSAALIQCGYLWRPMSQCTVTMSCRIYLARTVRADDHITRYPQQLARPLKVFGHRLPRPVLAPVTPPLKYPDFTSLRKQRLAQLSRQIYPSGPTGFGFPHRRSGGAGDLLRAQRQHVADAQPGL